MSNKVDKRFTCSSIASLSPQHNFFVYFSPLYDDQYNGMGINLGRDSLLTRYFLGKQKFLVHLLDDVFSVAREVQMEPLRRYHRYSETSIRRSRTIVRPEDWILTHHAMVHYWSEHPADKTNAEVWSKRVEKRKQ